MYIFIFYLARELLLLASFWGRTPTIPFGPWFQEENDNFLTLLSTMGPLVQGAQHLDPDVSSLAIMELLSILIESLLLTPTS